MTSHISRFQVLKRGYEDRLIVDDTSYDHQGEYVCEAVNMIGGVRKAVQSEPIQLEVRGNFLRRSRMIRTPFKQHVNKLSLWCPIHHFSGLILVSIVVLK